MADTYYGFYDGPDRMAIKIIDGNAETILDELRKACPDEYQLRTVVKRESGGLTHVAGTPISTSEAAIYLKSIHENGVEKANSSSPEQSASTTTSSETETLAAGPRYTAKPKKPVGKIPMLAIAFNIIGGIIVLVAISIFYTAVNLDSPEPMAFAIGAVVGLVIGIQGLLFLAVGAIVAYLNRIAVATENI